MTITSREMRALELNSEYFGVSRLQLMENAGRAVAKEILARFKPKKTKVAVFCGLGGNGGDGFVTARHLASHGFKVALILAGKSKDITDEEARKNWLALQSLNDVISLHEAYDSSLIPSVEANVVVDALLGIGLKGVPRPPILQIIKRINESNKFCVAVDVPTGINSDTGEVLGEAVKANLTVTFHKVKPGLEKAKAEVGELVIKKIGLPDEFERYAGPGDVQLAIKKRPAEAHKSDFGRLLVVGGSETFSGAPTLVALAALRTGVDLVYIAAPHRIAYAISCMSPNLITVKMEGDYLSTRNISIIRRYLETSTAIVMGPGLGLHKDTRDAVKEIVKAVEERKAPLLLDADGLKAFAESKRKVDFPLILTPHAGEYKLLTGREPPKGLNERAEDVRKTAQELDAVVLLKGHTDVISDGTRVKLNFTGNPGMTVGGTGDVLSGVVGAFLAWGADPFEAAVAGVFINGAAGDFVREEKGYHMVPTDLLEWIPKVMDDPMSHLKVRRSAT
ncbi:MAG: NAD(P)H-hydrate dehydratase [Candidatus Bathyarchaeia archaeon]